MIFPNTPGQGQEGRDRTAADESCDPRAHMVTDERADLDSLKSQSLRCELQRTQTTSWGPGMD